MKRAVLGIAALISLVGCVYAVFTSTVSSEGAFGLGFLALIFIIGMSQVEN